MPEQVFIWMDIGYTVIFDLGDGEAKADVFRHLGRRGPKPLYRGGLSFDVTVWDPDEAMPFAGLDYDIDGCYDWYFNTNEYPIHFCSHQEFQNFLRMMERAQETAKILLKVGA